ncbi:hypothetical protein CDAR_470911 [Caerostris darwini]|uniref:Uncharacterized protein n=1 Tax=Caerostris darwini TaxID=1538125 RepID=A0AAV4UKS2_9ARAC|nr:hypothetical protein CDAR_470911 [Caerostris darwini]
MTWFPIEEFRLNNTRYGSTDNSDGLPNAIFFIRDVQYSDNREISCITDNIDGSDQTTVNLEVRGETFFERNCKGNNDQIPVFNKSD